MRGRAARLLGAASPRARALAALAALAASLSSAGAARAELRLFPVPVLGPEALPGEGWGTVAVRLENTDAAPVRGTVEIQPDATPSAPKLSTTAPFSLGPGASAVLRMPTHGVSGWRLSITARGEHGNQLAASELSTSGKLDPLLVDVHDPPRLLGALRGATIAVRYEGEAGHGPGPLPLAVGGVWFDPATGDPVLPERTAEWGSATVVVISSDTLSRLVGLELEAIGGYVLAGGTLAIVPARPEDLRSAPLLALLGGEARPAGAARHLLGLKTAPLPRQPSYSGAPHPAPSGSAGAGDDEPPRGGVATPRAVGPTPELRDKLSLYEGGNLVRSDFGASAAYGLGEVHLLAFDPTSPPGVSDPWAMARLGELVRHAWDRRSAVVFANGGPAASERANTSDVRQQLDPNENSRWAILLAAVILLAYSVVAGPLNFSAASRSGKPLRALVALPILSGGVFVLLILLALWSKGVRGEARRLSLIEASGGMSRASIRRYRGFFTPAARTMTVFASDAGSVLDVAAESSAEPRVVVDRSGLKLLNVATLPWQTVVVREDGLISLAGGVSLTRAPGGDVRITNRSARDLRSLVVQVPGMGYYHLPSLKDGATALASTGKLLGTSPPGAIASAGSAATVRPLNIGTFGDDLNRASRGVTDAWEALASAARGRPVDWWPEELPVLMTQLDGGEGVTFDTGLAVDRDRTLLRVIGYGGLP